MVCTLAIGENPLEHRVTAEDEFDSLVRWLSDKRTLALTLQEVEQEQLQRSRELNRKLLQEHIRRRGSGDSGPKLSVHQEDNVIELERGRIRQRQIRSVFGQVEAHRRGYESKGLNSVHPLDEQLAIFGRSYSYEVRRWTVTAAVQGPFDEAIAAVRARTGLTISKRTAEELVVEVAADFESFYEQRQHELPESTGPIVVCQADCKGIPMKKSEPAVQKFKKQKGEKTNKKRMATVATVHTQDPRVRTPESVVESLFRTLLRDVSKPTKECRPQNKRIWASLSQSKDVLLQSAAAEVEKRDPAATKTRVVLTDGEKALQSKMKALLPTATQILDLIHALQYVWAIACVFFGEKSPLALEWMKKQTLKILQGKVSRVVQGIRQSATKRGLVGEKKAVVTRSTNYLLRNRDSMRYHQYLAAGLPIASGAVEGACKNLIKDRMERSGMRWVEKSAEAMLRLRAVYLSGDLEPYWTWHLAKERERYLSARAQPVSDVQK